MSGVFFLLLLSLTLGSPITPQNVQSIVPEGAAWDSAPAGALSKAQNQVSSIAHIFDLIVGPCSLTSCTAAETGFGD